MAKNQEEYSDDFDENDTITEEENKSANTSQLLSILSEIDELLDSNKKIGDGLNSARSQDSALTVSSRSATAVVKKSARSVTSVKSDQSDIEDILREIEKFSLPVSQQSSSTAIEKAKSNEKQQVLVGQKQHQQQQQNNNKTAKEPLNELRFNEPQPGTSTNSSTTTFTPNKIPQSVIENNKNNNRTSLFSMTNLKSKPSVNQNTTTNTNISTTIQQQKEPLRADSADLEIERLKNEMTKQESLIQAYQKENEKLFVQLKEHRNHDSSSKKREQELEDQMNDLKTEIATLKVNRLGSSAGSSSPQSARSKNDKLERLNEELNLKSQQIVELREDVARLKIENSSLEKKLRKSKDSAASAGGNDVGGFEEKEKELQRTINGLRKQVRTLQGILYNKNPNAPSTYSHLFGKEMSCSTTTKDESGTQIPLLESRIAELEKELEENDEESKKRVKEIQANFQNVKHKYEERINELEKRNEDMIQITKSPVKKDYDDISSRYERAQGEISILKMEINRYKRDLEILQKSTIPSATTNNKDSAALSQAIKQFKGEMAEKEKDIIKFKKEIDDLKKTNNHLKREREKYLAIANINKNNVRPGFVRTKSDLGAEGQQQKTQSTIITKPSRNSLGNRIRPQTNPAPKISVGTTNMLQQALENERLEFEHIISEKIKLLEMKDKQIKDLRIKIEHLLSEEGEAKFSLEQINITLEELRIRVSTQNKVIESLKFHLSKLSGIEGEFLRLKSERDEFEHRSRELAKKVAYLDSLNKPENEVLSVLSEKVEELSARYLYREKHLDTLINRLSLKTSSPSQSLDLTGLSPRVISILNGLLKNEKSEPPHNHFSSLDMELNDYISSTSPERPTETKAGHNSCTKI